jgi:RNA polymerase sigma-70 factor (ECF subfamily)
MSGVDGSYLERASEGDPEALRTLLQQFGPSVWSDIDAQIGARLRSALDADDVMQITYMEAFLQIGQFQSREPEAFVGWLRRIAENNLRDAIKELERKKRPNPAKRVTPAAGDDSYVALVEMLGGTTTTPSRAAAHREFGTLIEAGLAQLPPDYSAVIRMYDLEGQAIGEVAAALGRSTGAIHMLRARAHDRLRAVLGGEGDFFTHGG